MNKKQLIARVQRYMGPGATRSTASAAVEAVLTAIQLATAEPASKVHITHFGSFERIQRAARQGYDINTGTLRQIPAKSELCFKAAKALNDATTRPQPGTGTERRLQYVKNGLAGK